VAFDASGGFEIRKRQSILRTASSLMDMHERHGDVPEPTVFSRNKATVCVLDMHRREIAQDSLPGTSAAWLLASAKLGAECGRGQR
jgi:hypothetical protein